MPDQKSPLEKPATETKTNELFFTSKEQEVLNQIRVGTVLVRPSSGIRLEVKEIPPTPADGLGNLFIVTATSHLGTVISENSPLTVMSFIRALTEDDLLLEQPGEKITSNESEVGPVVETGDISEEKKISLDVFAHLITLQLTKREEISKVSDIRPTTENGKLTLIAKVEREGKADLEIRVIFGNKANTIVVEDCEITSQMAMMPKLLLQGQIKNDLNLIGQEVVNSVKRVKRKNETVTKVSKLEIKDGALVATCEKEVSEIGLTEAQAREIALQNARKYLGGQSLEENITDNSPETKKGADIISKAAIEHKIGQLLSERKEIQEILVLNVEGDEDEMTANISARVGGSLVQISVTIENTPRGIARKDYKIQVDNVTYQPLVNAFIEPTLKDIASVIKQEIEKEKGEEIKTIQIKDGNLGVTYTDEATPTTENLPPRRTVFDMVRQESAQIQQETPEERKIEQVKKPISRAEIQSGIEYALGKLDKPNIQKIINVSAVAGDNDSIAVRMRLKIKTGFLSTQEGETGFSLVASSDGTLGYKDPYVTTQDINPDGTMIGAMQLMPRLLQSYLNEGQVIKQIFEIKNGELFAILPPIPEEERPDIGSTPPPPPPRRTVEEMLDHIERTKEQEEKTRRIEKLKKELATLDEQIARLTRQIEELPDDDIEGEGENKKFILPPTDLLAPSEAYTQIADAELLHQAKEVAEKLAELGIPGKVKRITPGPRVTIFRFKPEGITLSRITTRSDGLSLVQNTGPVRIYKSVEDPETVEIEIPRPTIFRDKISLQSVIKSEKFEDSVSRLTLALGKESNGKNNVTDLRELPHILIGGGQETGKRELIHSILISMLYKASPDESKLIIIDSKNELQPYADIPHLLIPIIPEPKNGSTDGTKVLKWAKEEMNNRYKQLAQLGLRNIDIYNTAVRDNNQNTKSTTNQATLAPLPYITIVINELSDLMMTSPKETEENIIKLAQMARVVGIHMIIATEHPQTDTIPSLVKASIPARIALQTTSKIDSRLLIDQNGAEALLGKGDMLFMPPGTSKVTRIHAPSVDEGEVKRVCDFVRSQGKPVYNEEILK